MGSFGGNTDFELTLIKAGVGRRICISPEMSDLYGGTSLLPLPVEEICTSNQVSVKTGIDAFTE
jgi:hypothetical protein